MTALKRLAVLWALVLSLVIGYGLLTLAASVLPWPVRMALWAQGAFPVGGGAGGSVPNSPPVTHVCPTCQYKTLDAYSKTWTANHTEIVEDDTCGDHLTLDPLAPNGINVFVTIIQAPCTVPITTDVQIVLGHADQWRCFGAGALVGGFATTAQGCAVIPTTSFPARIADPTSNTATYSTAACTQSPAYTDVWSYYSWENPVGGWTQRSPEAHQSGITAGNCETFTPPAFPSGVSSYDLYVTACNTSCSTTNNGTTKEVFWGNFSTTATQTINTMVAGSKNANLFIKTSGVNTPGPATNSTGALFFFTGGNQAAQNQIYQANALVDGIAISCSSLAGSTWTAQATTGFYIGDSQEVSQLHNVRVKDCGEHAITVEGFDGTGSTGAENFGPIDNFSIDDSQASGGICGGGNACDPGAIPEGNTLSCQTHTSAVLFCQVAGGRGRISNGTITPNGQNGTTLTKVGIEVVGPDANWYWPGDCPTVDDHHVEGLHSVILYAVEDVNCFGNNISRIQGLLSSNGHTVHLDATSWANLENIFASGPYSVCGVLDDWDGIGCGGSYDSSIPIVTGAAPMGALLGSPVAGQFMLAGYSGNGIAAGACTGTIGSSTTDYLSGYSTGTACSTNTAAIEGMTGRYLLPTNLKLIMTTAETGGGVTDTIGLYDVTQAKFMISCTGASTQCAATNSSNWIAPSDTWDLRITTTGGTANAAGIKLQVRFN